jgi:cysteine-S-conjugate beta-lyase
MRYDFDTVIDRRGTCAEKWEPGNEELDRQDNRHDACGPTLPLWVADMDFVCPQPVVEALICRAQHGIFGYTVPTEPYFNAVAGWMQRRQGWEIACDWICVTPGVVPALNMLVETFVAPGDKVLIQPPVYHPFFSAVRNNRATLVTSPLVFEDGRYRMDYADLEAKAADPQVRMAILCSPHNPVGRVWSREELRRFGEICLANDVLVVADEIHGDLILNGNTFTPYAGLSDVLSKRCVVCTAPSKTFNLAGLAVSNIVIPNAEIRSRFAATVHRHGLSGINAFGVVAAEAAYNDGDEWLDQVLEYIAGNLAALQEYVERYIPQIAVIPPEGTYLVWLDCRRLGLNNRELKRLMRQEAGVRLNDGHIFGPQGEGFQRINIACPRALLMAALQRIEVAIRKVRSL